MIRFAHIDLTTIYDLLLIRDPKDKSNMIRLSTNFLNVQICLVEINMQLNIRISFLKLLSQEICFNSIRSGDYVCYLTLML